MSDEIPPPRLSPHLPMIGDDERPSGSHKIPVMRADLKNYRTKFREELAKVDEIRDEEIASRVKKGLDRNLVIAVVGAVSIAFGAFFAVRSEAQAVTDAGTKRSEDKLADHITLENAKYALLNEKMADMKTELREQTSDIKKQNAALLAKFNVPDPVSSDGGR